SPWSCSQKPIIGHAVLASINVRFTPESGHGDLRVKVPASHSKAAFSVLCAVPRLRPANWSQKRKARNGWVPLRAALWAQPDITETTERVPCSVVVLKPCTTPFYGVAHVVEYKDCEGRHALPLFWTKSFVQWLPRLGEFVQIG